ncbi:phage major capsid protein [Rickettsia endosymbiont of Cardiosporidium cionae]|uniref:phage major capsid protein n=1 Tax=Rickettsia endosymbiont of Cardiosporidium cionae TaxID=2777155 RepID=UPI001893ED9D|nr:phage major capsid protein [Rickettsia endosymbiont of Cardiosporidium cionae]KAF8818806.1 phage major capsid protein [Rickettsia endosymbiont of Cardiosporidium cionae]
MLQETHTLKNDQDKIDNINNILENFIETKEKSFNKVQELEKKIYNMQEFFNKDDTILAEDTQQDTKYRMGVDDFIRKGNIDEKIIKKSLNSSNNNEGSVVLESTLYRQIISSISEQSIIRKLASIESISSNAFEVIKDQGIFNSGWVGEIDARDTTETPQLIKQSIPVHELYAQPKATQTLIDDSYIDMDKWITEKLSESFSKMENEAFINGDGNKKPSGILYDPEDKVQKISVGLDNITIDANILLNLLNALDPSYTNDATFLMNRTTLSALQSLQDQMGRFIWQQSIEDKMKQTIFGVPVVCCSNMPSINAGTVPVVLGNFKHAYKIIDRNTITLMRDPYTEKPFIKFYAVKRVGGAVISPDAMVFLKIKNN